MPCIEIYGNNLRIFGNAKLAINELAPLRSHMAPTRNIPHYAAKLNAGTPVKFTFPSFNMFSLINVTLRFCFQLFYGIQHILHERRRAVNTSVELLVVVIFPLEEIVLKHDRA